MTPLAAHVDILVFCLFQFGLPADKLFLAEILGLEGFGPPFPAFHLTVMGEANDYDEAPEHPTSSPRPTL